MITGRPHHSIPVLDPTGTLCGMLTFRDFVRVLTQDTTIGPLPATSLRPS
jgi:hypothetical protein